ncbi:MAG: carboxylating nicotinate-nucleotide diphosphorylase [Candidatus Omnitrophota bacterium]|nr:carboxylating nicotinate-nucleotide diphosphorylase [Candidatus Omnitrophota bacterium]
MGLDKSFLSEKKPALDLLKLDQVIRRALIEDIGKGDITTQLTIPKDKITTANIITKQGCLVCGLKAAERGFKIVDANTKFEAEVKEGSLAKKGKVLARVSGKASSILTAERVALNLLSMLSGIASKTKEYVKEVKPYKVKITDTRKTLPGLRELQKYAVRIGGGYSHRTGLDEMLLIKDNHIKVTEGYDKLPSVPKGFKIEIEVQNLDEFRHALRFKPDVIMLDNMSLVDMKEAVSVRNKTEFKSHHPPTKLEASGGIDLKNLKEVAACGVDIISIGELTHSVEAVDISLDIVD